MISPVKELNPAARSSTQETSAESTLAELRDTVTAIAKEVATLAERRTRAARQSAIDTAEAGASEVRRNIRRQPVVAMAVAVAAGAVLALVVVPRFTRPSTVSRWDKWTPNMPSITRSDLHDFADNIQRSVSRAAHSAAAPITPAFERLVEAVTRADAGGSMGTLLEKASGWFQKAQERAKDKMS